jgi:hypothetical protein
MALQAPDRAQVRLRGRDAVAEGRKMEMLFRGAGDE